MRSRASRHANQRCFRILRAKCECSFAYFRMRQRLLLEEIVEGAAGIVGARGACCERRWRGLGRGGRGVLFDRGAKFVERAIVLQIFARDALEHGLHALKARGAIEIAALLAAMKIEGAARALRVWIDVGLQHRAAIRAAHARNRADHSRSARSKLFLTRAAIVRRPFFLFFRLVVRHVAVLLILPVQENLRGDAPSYATWRERT